MRTALTVAFLACSVAVCAAQERLADQLRKGIVQEEASQNLEKAIKAYEAILAQFDEDRKAAATALFRLAECYRKTGKRDQAVAAYQRVVREFADHVALVEPSRQQLAKTYGLSEPRLVRPTMPAATREPRPEAMRDLERRIAEIQLWLGEYEAKVKAGLASRDNPEYVSMQRELEAARRRLEVSRTAEQAASARNASSQAEIALERELWVKQVAVKDAERQVAAVQDRIADYEMRIRNRTASRESAEFRQLQRDLEAARDRLELARLDLDLVRKDLQVAQSGGARGRVEVGRGAASGTQPERAGRGGERRQVTPEALQATQIEMDTLQKQMARAKQLVDVGLASPQEYHQLQAEFQTLVLRYQEQLKTREASEATAREVRALNERLIQSLETEIHLLTRWIEAAEKGVIKGYTSDSPELLKLRRELLDLQRKLDELKTSVKR